jgi:hypothetical protein
MSILRIIGGFLLVACLTSLVVAEDSRPDISKIITKDEATAILGEPVNDPSPRSGNGTDGYYSKCNYYSAHRGKSLIIRFQMPGPNAIAPQKELELLEAASGPMEKVSGVGDTAQMLVGGGDGGFGSRVLMLYVVKGNAFLTIGVGGFTDDAIALEKAKTIAQKIIEHL